MRMDKLTNQLQTALSDAQSLAVGRDHSQIEPGHLLLALLEQQGGSIRPLLSRAGVNVADLRRRLQERLEQLPKVQNPTGEVQLAPELARLLNMSDRLSQRKGDKFISSEIALLAALEEAGEISALLKKSGADRELLEQAIDQLRGGEAVDDPEAEGAREALDKFTIDLTERAEQGKTRSGHRARRRNSPHRTGVCSVAPRTTRC